MDVFGGCGERTLQTREAKHSDIKLILNKVRAAQVINVMGLKKGKITSCRNIRKGSPSQGLWDGQKVPRHSM